MGLITSLFEKFYYSSERAGANPRSSNSALRTPHSVFEASLLTSAPTMVKKRPPPHESGHKHVTGEAEYTDDMALEEGTLEVWPVCSPHARAKIIKRDVVAASKMPGIRAVLLAEHVPGLNDTGTKHDEVLLPDKEVSFHGQ